MWLAAAIMWMLKIQNSALQLPTKKQKQILRRRFRRSISPCEWLCVRVCVCYWNKKRQESVRGLLPPVVFCCEKKSSSTFLIFFFFPAKFSLHFYIALFSSIFTKTRCPRYTLWWTRRDVVQLFRVNWENNLPERRCLVSYRQEISWASDLFFFKPGVTGLAKKKSSRNNRPPQKNLVLLLFCDHFFFFLILGFIPIFVLFQIVLFIVWPWKSIVGQWRIHVTVHRIVKKKNLASALFYFPRILTLFR